VGESSIFSEPFDKPPVRRPDDPDPAEENENNDHGDDDYDR
jgi:hypothetical protein